MAKPADLRPLPDLVPPVPKGIYTLTNDTTDNQLAIFARAADGTLTAQQPVSTAGRGTGAGLGDQGALIFNRTTNLFFAVNAGDNSISMLMLNKDGTVTLLYNILSGGVRPVSITESNGKVYVVNAGNNFALPNITGFQVSGVQLMPLANSTQTLAANGVGPAQIQFTPDGQNLVVTEKTTNKIDVFPISAGLPGAANSQASNGMTPFGFAFSAMGKLIVSEAAMATANAGSTSSYSIGANGMLTTISNKLVSGQTAPCWVAVSGTTAYVTNAQSNNVTAYKVAADGGLTLLASGNSGMTGMGPSDEAVTEGNEFLYTLNNRDHSFSIFTINVDGTLTKKPDFQGAPMNAVGLVAR